jgi:hypothetical protein
MQHKPTNAQKRTRGRPKNIATLASHIYKQAFKPNEVEALSKSIAHLLGIAISSFTYELAHVLLAYLPLKEFCKNAPMRLGCTNRPKIHRDILMRDIACVYSRYAGTSPLAELRKINFSREQRLANKRASGVIVKQPAVEAATRAVLHAAGEKYLGSLRRTAKNARAYLKAD